MVADEASSLEGNVRERELASLSLSCFLGLRVSQWIPGEIPGECDAALAGRVSVKSIVLFCPGADFHLCRIGHKT